MRSGQVRLAALGRTRSRFAGPGRAARGARRPSGGTGRAADGHVVDAAAGVEHHGRARGDPAGAAVVRRRTGQAAGRALRRRRARRGCARRDRRGPAAGSPPSLVPATSSVPATSPDWRGRKENDTHRQFEHSIQGEYGEGPDQAELLTGHLANGTAAVERREGAGRGAGRDFSSRGADVRDGRVGNTPRALPLLNRVRPS